MTNKMAVLLIVTATSLMGFQGEFEFRYQPPGRALAGTVQRTDQLSAQILHDLATGSFDPQASAVLSAAEAYTKGMFRNDSTQQLKTATRREADGDVLLVSWRITGPLGGGMLYLRDTPYKSSYVARFPTNTPASKQVLARVLSGVLRWDHPPLDISARNLPVSVSTDSKGIEAFAIRLLSSSVDGPYNFDVRGVFEQAEVVVGIELGKKRVRGYPVDAFVPERFPPLQELAKGWDFGKLWNEIRLSGQKRTISSEARDRILVTELVQRGITDRQVVELLTQTTPDNLKDRAMVTLGVLEACGRQELVQSGFSAALEEYRRIGRPSSGAVEM